MDINGNIPYSPTQYVLFIKTLNTQCLGLFIWIFMGFFFSIRCKKKKLQEKSNIPCKYYASLQGLVEYFLDDFYCYSNKSVCPAKEELDFKEEDFLDIYSIYINKLGLFKELPLDTQRQEPEQNSINTRNSNVEFVIPEPDLILPVSIVEYEEDGFYDMNIFERNTVREPFDKEMPNYSDIHGSLEFFVNYLSLNKMNYFRLSTFEYRMTDPMECYNSVCFIKDGVWSELDGWSNFTNGKNTNKMITSWLDANNNKMQDEEKALIERYIINISIFPGLPIVYLLSKLFGGDESTQKEMQVKCLCYLPRLQMSALFNYQHKMSKFLDLYNPYVHKLDYFGNLMGDNRETNLASDILALLIFGKIVSNEMFYICFFYRFVVLQKSFQSHRNAIAKYSHVSPLFIQCIKNKFYMIHKGKMYYSNIYGLIEYWIHVNKNIGIPPLTESIECPWIDDWLNELPNAFTKSEIFHGLCITKNYINPNREYANYSVISMINEQKKNTNVQQKRKFVDISTLL
jgi:hypothetical protein